MDMAVHTFNSRTQEAEAGGINELKASLVFIVSSWTATAIHFSVRENSYITMLS